MNNKKLILKATLFSTICGLIISIILMCICTIIIISTGLLPDQITNYLTLAILGLGALFGGFIGARITKSNGLIIGLLTGLLIFVLVTVVGIIKSDEPVSYLVIIRLVLTLVLGASGGILGVNKRDKLKIK